MKKLTHDVIVRRQIERSMAPKLPLVVILNDIRSLHNVGAIFRTADGIGVAKLWLCGITGFPPQSGVSKTALGAEDSVCWEYTSKMIPVVESYKKQGYEIVVLEQVDNSLSHDQYQPERPVCLIVGNEVDGVSDDVMSLVDVALEIDMAGIKNSLNVGVAFGIVGYAIRTHLKNMIR